MATTSWLVFYSLTVHTIDFPPAAAFSVCRWSETLLQNEGVVHVPSLVRPIVNAKHRGELVFKLDRLVLAIRCYGVRDVRRGGLRQILSMAVPAAIRHITSTANRTRSFKASPSIAAFLFLFYTYKER
jgi:hypothetical protein